MFNGQIALIVYSEVQWLQSLEVLNIRRGKTPFGCGFPTSSPQDLSVSTLSQPRRCPRTTARILVGPCFFFSIWCAPAKVLLLYGLIYTVTGLGKNKPLWPYDLDNFAWSCRPLFGLIRFPAWSHGFCWCHGFRRVVQFRAVPMGSPKHSHRATFRASRSSRRGAAFPDAFGQLVGHP